MMMCVETETTEYNIKRELEMGCHSAPPPWGAGLDPAASVFSPPSWRPPALAVKAGPPHRPHSHPSRGVFLGYQPQERDVTAATSSPKGRSQLLREYMDLLGTAHDPPPGPAAPRGPRFPTRRSGQGGGPPSRSSNIATSIA